MNGNIQELIKKITESEELQAKFAALGSPEEAYELAKTLQEGFTKEEFLAAAKALSAAADGDISDEDLAAAAGGMDDDDRRVPTEVPDDWNKLRDSMNRITNNTRSDPDKASKALAV